MPVFSAHSQALLVCASILIACTAEDEHAVPRDASPADDAGRDVDGAVSPPDATFWLDEDCDPEDPQRGSNFYERFGDGVDSNCDGEDDPASNHEPCTCSWIAGPERLDVSSSCATHFNPSEAQLAVGEARGGEPRCIDLPDLTLSFVVQCRSDCLGVPIYFSVANLGGARSGAATVRVLGSFRKAPPITPLAIEPLDPGEHTSLIDLPATGALRLVLETDGEQCSVADDEIELDAYDRHCGFFP